MVKVPPTILILFDITGPSGDIIRIAAHSDADEGPIYNVFRIINDFVLLNISCTLSGSKNG